MIGAVVRKVRGRRLLPGIVDNDDFYAQAWAAEEAHAWQLDRFNRQWSNIRQTVPYFRERASALPDSFSSWEQFMESMPVMSRKVVQEQRDALTDRRKAPDFVRTTGGSTSEPVQLPSWDSERAYGNRDLWYARSWYGVTPADRLFMIWGHSHLLGRGLRGWISGRKRMVKDWLLGYLRWSAYDLSEGRMRAAAEACLRFRPAYVVAYAGALDRFARVNQDRAAEFRRLNLKVAIATAEAFPRSDSAAFVSDVLACPVAMEYGAMETGPIAHETLAGDYFVFWRHYFVEADAEGELRITSLYPRCQPLIRYEIGDLAAGDNVPGYSLRRFARVVGRCNDFILLDDGRPVHSEAFTHAVKESPIISDFQVVQGSNGRITLSLVGTDSIGEDDLYEVRRRLGKFAPQLATIDVRQVGRLEQTVAGKTKRIVRVVQ